MDSRRKRRFCLAGVTMMMVGVTVAGPAAQADPADQAPGRKWQLVYTESFGAPTGIDQAPWVRDPHGEDSPWNVDHLDDDGEFFRVKGGPEFERQLQGTDILRKRVAFGRDGWLTAELGAFDVNKDGVPDAVPSVDKVDMGGDAAARLDVPGPGGVIIRNTKPLPSRYRVEYTLRTIDFGGKRHGSWNYDGKINGYDPGGCKTSWPWKTSGEFSGPANPCNSHFGDVRSQNGYYFLAIMDYLNPAPHNNVFIHNHRKVGMDGYNVSSSFASVYKVCNPATGKLQSYPDSSGNAINEIFFDGSRFRDPSIGYNEFIMPTECGVRDGSDPNATIASAAEIQPELMPGESYTFAIERDATGYVTEMTGNFRYIGHTTLRYHRDFVQDGRPIWHYNQTPEEYDGSFNSTLTFSGPYGSYSKEQWPKGSAYPDSFIIGDPHLNFYEGSATIDDIRFYVPGKPS